MARWEYRTVKLKVKGLFGGKVDESELTTILNDTGLEGWELVSAPCLNQGYGSTASVLLIFKRPGR